MGEVICHNLLPGAIRNISRKHWLWRGRGFVFCAYGALVDIVSYVSIYARPIHCLTCLGLHPIDTLMGSMQISKGMIEELWGNADSCPLRSRPESMDSSSLTPQKCLAMWGTSCKCSGHPPRVRQ